MEIVESRMRIIAGEFRSRLLLAPRGMETRPTSDRLRETLFNVLSPRLADARFLDLYAGSGANGLEALSRGAAHAVFVERATAAVAAIRANIAALGTAARATVVGRAVAGFLREAAGGAVPGFDIVFLDPPYAEANEYTQTLEWLGADGATLVGAGGIVVAEHRRTKGREPLLASSYGRLRQTRLLTQGDAALAFYARGEDL